MSEEFYVLFNGEYREFLCIDNDGDVWFKCNKYNSSTGSYSDLVEDYNVSFTASIHEKGVRFVTAPLPVKRTKLLEKINPTIKFIKGH